MKIPNEGIMDMLAIVYLLFTTHYSLFTIHYSPLPSSPTPLWAIQPLFASGAGDVFGPEDDGKIPATPGDLFSGKNIGPVVYPK